MDVGTAEISLQTVGQGTMVVLVQSHSLDQSRRDVATEEDGGDVSFSTAY